MDRCRAPAPDRSVRPATESRSSAAVYPVDSEVFRRRGVWSARAVARGPIRNWQPMPQNIDRCGAPVRRRLHHEVPMSLPPGDAKSCVRAAAGPKRSSPRVGGGAVCAHGNGWTAGSDHQQQGSSRPLPGNRVNLTPVTQMRRRMKPQAPRNSATSISCWQNTPNKHPLGRNKYQYLASKKICQSNNATAVLQPTKLGY